MSKGRARRVLPWIVRRLERAIPTYRSCHLSDPSLIKTRILFTRSRTRDFWRKGLAPAWGDPGRLSDSNVLRPLMHTVVPPPPDDRRLFGEVASLAGTRVVIMYRLRDRVVRIDDGAAKAPMREFPNVHVIKMEGCRHDPFEEDVPGFLMVLEKALEG